MMVFLVSYTFGAMLLLSVMPNTMGNKFSRPLYVFVGLCSLICWSAIFNWSLFFGRVQNIQISQSGYVIYHIISAIALLFGSSQIKSPVIYRREEIQQNISKVLLIAAGLAHILAIAFETGFIIAKA